MTTAPSSDTGLNIVERLRLRIGQARAAGFVVRQEVLGGHLPAWCVLAGRKTLFLDSTQPAREQLAILEEALAAHASGQAV